MRREFTGRHMLIVLVAGFGVVVAVNFFMASLAARGFSGVVVENSYVASQHFNGWLAQAERQQALGWEAKLARAEDGRLRVETSGVPASATLRADIRRPLGDPELAELELVPDGTDAFTTPEPVADGRWIIRLYIDAGGQEWRREEHLP
ncbi:MAG: hypothetical protein APF78_03235 [Sphingomonadales bacterium BRH_c3]|nr:MAG: hypothetical protein APF78_03235 [Sphingomonadales bacterium BRH_c3]